MIDEQWKEFESKQDWSYHNRHNWPTFEECFKQGIKVGLNIKEELRKSTEQEREFFENDIVLVKQNNYCEGV